MELINEIAEVTGKACRLISPLSGKGIYLAQLGKERVVVKNHPHAKVEAKMLAYLAQYLCVPEVIISRDRFLVMTYIESSGFPDPIKVADVLARLHRVEGAHFGFSFDTTIGPYPQANTANASWIDFFREQRVLHMARCTLESGRITPQHYKKIEALAFRFEKLLFEPVPSLLHGDIWGGNVLNRGGEVCFIDPALYCGHNEVELAFILMFDTFGRDFFNRYNEQLPIEPGFFEERQHLYRLYPVLVHIRSFGASYLGMLEQILRRFA